MCAWSFLMVVYQKNDWLVKIKFFFSMLEHWALISNYSKQGTQCWHSDHDGLGKTVGNVKFMVLGGGGAGSWWMGLWCVWCFVLFCMRFFFSLSASDRNSAVPTFWRPPRKTEGSCILDFPWDLMKYTAPGLLSIWTFRLLSQYKGVLAVTNITWLGSPAAWGFSCQLLT